MYPCTDLPSELTGKVWAKGLLQRPKAINEISLIYVIVDAFSKITFCSFQNKMCLSHPLFLQLHFLPHEDTEFTDLKSPWPSLEPFKSLFSHFLSYSWQEPEPILDQPIHALLHPFLWEDFSVRFSSVSSSLNRHSEIVSLW